MVQRACSHVLGILSGLHTHFTQAQQLYERDSMGQHSTAQHSTAQHSTAQHSTAQHSTAQHSTAQHSAAQRSAAQHSTAQHSIAQHSTAALTWPSFRLCTASAVSGFSSLRNSSSASISKPDSSASLDSDTACCSGMSPRLLHLQSCSCCCHMLKLHPAQVWGET